MTQPPPPALLDYLRQARLATVSTVGPDGAPQAALVGIAVMDDGRILFDTVSNSRKHGNLCRDPRVALVVSGPGDRTLQYEGRAHLTPCSGPEGAYLREAYYAAWPDGRSRLAWPNLRYWCVSPNWVRFTDYDRRLDLVHVFG